MPFRALDHDTLLSRLVAESQRENDAYEQLAASANPSVSFTGTRITKERAAMHSRSEGALHRWDITGDGDTSQALLSQPELATYAVWVLDNMHMLNESAHALGTRAGMTTSTIVVFRTEGQPDIVLTLGPASSRFELMDEAMNADLVLTMRTDHRPLLLWAASPQPSTRSPKATGIFLTPSKASSGPTRFADPGRLHPPDNRAFWASRRERGGGSGLPAK